MLPPDKKTKRRRAENERKTEEKKKPSVTEEKTKEEKKNGEEELRESKHTRSITKIQNDVIRRRRRARGEEMKLVARHGPVWLAAVTARTL